MVEFWYEFASTYSYLSAMRIETLASDYGVEIAWRPFLLGPIFKKRAGRPLPSTCIPPGRLHVARHGTALQTIRPAVHLAVSLSPDALLAARIAHAAQNQPWIGAFTRAVLSLNSTGAEYRRRKPDGRTAAGNRCPGPTALSTAQSRENKISLRAAVTEAEKLGIFGAPSFVIPGGDLYWGDDRLEQALEAAGNLVETDA